MSDNKITEYIIEESPEISMGEAPGWGGRFFRAFPAFKSRSYRMYFVGQLISLIGTWLQTVAQGWLVFQLTHSAFWVGTITAIGSLPILMLALFGGVIVDRYNKKYILLFTQSFAMILAFALGILAWFQIVNIWEVAVLSFLLGVTSAIDMPARQSFVVEMVGKENLASAIALNSGIFNAARAIGPAVSGVLVALVGTAGAFILNGVSYVAVIIALLLMRVKIELPKVHPHPLHAIREGITYAGRHSVIRILLIFAAGTSVFGWSYTTVMPVIVADIFHKSALELGYFYSISGIGALLGAFVVSIFSKKANPFRFIMFGNTVFSCALILFSFTNYMPLAFVFLFFAGFGLVMQFSMINTTIQHLVEDRIRGRVMSIYTLMFIGLSPVGSFEIGLVSEHFGTQFAVRAGAILVLCMGFVLFSIRKKIDREYRMYTGNNN
ncbi:MAG: MFS transporter [Candidatus Spechtbacteria bacterium]|nr:MFS transporter [Candidatus Spechtbacteria bacterium]